MCKLAFVLVFLATASLGRRAQTPTRHQQLGNWKREYFSSQKRESQLAALLLALRHPAAAWQVSGHSGSRLLRSSAAPEPLAQFPSSPITRCRSAPVHCNIFGDILDGDKLKPQKPYEKPLMPSLVLDTPATYQLQENMWSLSGEDFRVKDISGNEVIQVAGFNVNLGGMVVDKLGFLDNTGKKWFSVERRMLAASTCYDIYSGDGKNLIAKIEREWMTMTPKYQFYYEGDDNPFGDFYAEGSFSDRQYTFKTAGGFETIAKVRRAPEVVNDVDNYAVDVAPGVDAAAIIAIAVVIDEDHDEEDAKKKRESQEEEGWNPFR